MKKIKYNWNCYQENYFDISFAWLPHTNKSDNSFISETPENIFDTFTIPLVEFLLQARENISF